jgi:hypothetical protein
VGDQECTAKYPRPRRVTVYGLVQQVTSLTTDEESFCATLRAEADFASGCTLL